MSMGKVGWTQTIVSLSEVKNCLGFSPWSGWRETGDSPVMEPSVWGREGEDRGLVHLLASLTVEAALH